MTKRTFTYGDQFSPDKFSLAELIDLCIKANKDRTKLQDVFN